MKNADLRWPLAERLARISVCASTLASYSIVVGLEQWDKDDPRGVVVFRAERHAQGEAFPGLLLLWRIPLAGLTRDRAEEAFVELAAWLRGRAQTDAIREEAKP